MSDQDKRKNLPLPSMLSNLRNVGRSSIYQQEPTRASPRYEIQPLMIESSPPAATNNITSARRIGNHVYRFFDNVQNMPVFERNKNKFRRRERGRRKGFKVDLPPKFIIYTILIFIVLPLILGSFFLVMQLSGSLKEDESHPLHKKQLRFRSNTNSTQVDGQNANFTETTTHLESPVNATHKVEDSISSEYDYVVVPITNVTATVTDLPSKDIEGDISANADDAGVNATIVVTTGSPREDQR